MINSQLTPVSRQKRLRSVESFTEKELRVINFRHVGILTADIKFFYLFIIKMKPFKRFELFKRLEPFLKIADYRNSETDFHAC